MRISHALLAAAALSLLISSPGIAYKRLTSGSGQPLRWHSNPMQFNIDNSSAPPGVNSSAFQAAIKASYQIWSTVSCSYFKTQDMGLTSNKNGNSSDKVNTNTVPSSWNQSPNALGVTLTYMMGDKIVDADTVYNPNRQWSTTGAYSKIDVQAVATHEIGHQLGLDHSSYSDATMYYAVGAGNLGPRSLHSDDIAGLCAIYPSGSQPPPECTKDSDCAAGEKCQSNKCVTGSTGSKGYGSPCSSNNNCKSGLCLKDTQGKTFCSDFCGSKSCPNGDKCVDIKDNQGKTYKVCYPGSNSWGSTKLGKPCTSSAECKDKYCAPVSGKGYLCASACDYTKSNSCPSGYTCTKYQTSTGSLLGLCVPGATTPPPTKKKMGESCSKHADCESNVCLNTGKGAACTIYCQMNQSNSCPSGFICISHSSGKGVCFKGSTPPPPIKKGSLGDPCKAASECKSNLCANQTYCTKLCDPNNPEAACGLKYGCVSAGTGKHVCYGTTSSNNPLSDDGGCEVVPASDSAQGLLLLFLALPLLIMLRRRPLK